MKHVFDYAMLAFQRRWRGGGVVMQQWVQEMHLHSSPSPHSISSRNGGGEGRRYSFRWNRLLYGDIVIWMLQKIKLHFNCFHCYSQCQRIIWYHLWKVSPFFSSLINSVVAKLPCTVFREYLLSLVSTLILPTCEFKVSKEIRCYLILV